MSFISKRELKSLNIVFSITPSLMYLFAISSSTSIISAKGFNR
jgi:hypothetical protein